MGIRNSHFKQALNKGFGYEDLSEEGIEACNKLIRRNRYRLSRKFSFEDNIKDVFIRLISQGQDDPILEIYSTVSKKRLGNR